MTRITRRSLFRPKYRVQVIRIIRGAIPSTASILILYRTGDKINERFYIYHWFPFVMIRNWGGQSRKRGYSFNERDQKCSYVNLTPVSVIKFASPMIFVSLTRNATTCNALIRRNLQSEETTAPSDHLRARSISMRIFYNCPLRVKSSIRSTANDHLTFHRGRN